MVEKKERLWHLDNEKAILMFLVVLGHFLAPASGYKTEYQFIYIFHMPCFIFVSGYFSKKDVKVVDAFCKYLAPYLVFQTFYILLGHFLHTPTGSSDLIGYITSPFHALWYLAALFCWTLILNFVDDKKIKVCFCPSFYSGIK